MIEILQLVGIAALLSGLVLRLMLRKHRTDFARSLTWRDRAWWWWPPWKASTILTSRGVSMFWISTSLIYVGLIAYGITRWIL